MANNERELIEAAEAVVARWYTPKWKDEQATAVFINRLRDALAGPAQGGLSDADRGDIELVIARLEDISTNGDALEVEQMAWDALVCARAIESRIRGQQGVPSDTQIDAAIEAYDRTWNPANRGLENKQDAIRAAIVAAGQQGWVSDAADAARLDFMIEEQCIVDRDGGVQGERFWLSWFHQSLEIEADCKTPREMIDIGIATRAQEKAAAIQAQAGDAPTGGA